MIHARWLPSIGVSAAGRGISLEANGWRLAMLVGVWPWVIEKLLDLMSQAEATVFETVALVPLGTALLSVEIAALSFSFCEAEPGDVP